MTHFAQMVWPVWSLGMIPGAAALYWAAKRFRKGDDSDAARYSRKFYFWTTIFVAFWAVGVALDLMAKP